MFNLEILVEKIYYFNNAIGAAKIDGHPNKGL